MAAGMAAGMAVDTTKAGMVGGTTRAVGTNRADTAAVAVATTRGRQAVAVAVRGWNTKTTPDGRTITTRRAASPSGTSRLVCRY